MLSKTTKFENLPKAVLDSLVGMDQKGMIRFVNRQTESLFGYDRGASADVLCDASVYRDVNGVVLGMLTAGRETAKATSSPGLPDA